MNEKTLAQAIVKGLIPYIVGSRNETKSLGTVLTNILGEVKKKEQYEYEIEIDYCLREKLKGKDGETPLKGKDYFTEQEIQEIIDKVVSIVTPVAGQDYYTAEEKIALINEIKANITIPPPVKGEDGLTPEKGIDYFTAEDVATISEEIISKVTEQLQAQETIKGKDVIDALRKLPKENALQIKDIYGLHKILVALDNKRGDRGATGPKGENGGGTGGSSAWGGITGTLSDQTDLQTALNGKQNTSEKDSANGYAGLDAGGKINPSQLPSIAITDTFVVASQVAMLALSAQTGDLAIRTDEGKTYILQGSNPATLGDWVLIQTPTDVVTSVFGRTGTVTAQSGDYNTLQVTENTNLYFTTARVLATLLAGFSVSGTRTAIIASDSILTAFGKVQKYFNDLSAIAFSGSASDLSGTKTSAFISDFASAVASLITGKQDTLVSGTNLKTVGGNNLLGAGDIPLTGGLSDGAIAFNLARSSGLQVGDGFKAIVPFGATILGWSIATKDGTAGTITLDVKKVDYAGVPTFAQIDGTDPILLSGASKNTSSALTGWTTTITEDDHVEITVASVTGTVLGVYGIIKVSKTS